MEFNLKRCGLSVGIGVLFLFICSTKGLTENYRLLKKPVESSQVGQKFGVRNCSLTQRDETSTIRFQPKFSGASVFLNKLDKKAVSSQLTERQTRHDSDKALTLKVEKILASASQEIKVVVKNRILFLYGDIEEDSRYSKIITRAASIPGIKDVNADHLMVKNSTQPLYDVYLVAKVKGALKQGKLKDTNRFNESIVIKVNNGQVFLIGLIPSQIEKEKILNVVRSVKGVIKINDQLKVQTK